MYNPHNLDLARLRQQELIAEADRARVAKAARRARRQRRVLVDRTINIDNRPTPMGPALPARA